MPYIGKIPAIGNYQTLDAITASATATYALTKGGVAVFPQTPANCIVSLNGVIQAPFSSYNISGSNIVFASALTGSDSIDFITVLGDVLSIGTPTDGTVTTAKLVDSSVTTAKLNDGSVSLAKLTATGTQDATTFLRGDNTFAVAGGDNTPAFLATSTGEVTVANTTETKLTNYTVEVFDTDNCYASSRFTPTVAGKYCFSAITGTYPAWTGTVATHIKKNGTTLGYTNHYSAGYFHGIITAICEMNGSTDYVEVYTYQDSGASRQFDGGSGIWFGGYKIIT
jgi:hypothetical protein